MTVLSWHTVFTCGDDLQIYSGVIFHETRHHTQAHVTSGAFIHCAFSLAERWTQMAPELGGWFRWPVLVMEALMLHNICCGRTRSSNQSGGGVTWLFPASSIKFLTRRSVKSQGVYLAPHEDNSIQQLSTLTSRKWKTMSWSTWSYVDSSNNCWPYDQNCRCNPCASCTVPWCEVSQGSCCRHKTFLLLVVGPYLSACKFLVCPSKLMWSNLPFSSPLCHAFSI